MGVVKLTVFSSEVLQLPFLDNIPSTEDIILAATKELGFLPPTRYLFGIFNRNLDYWIPENSTILSSPTDDGVLELRVRYHPFCLDKICKDDPKFLKYYFQQLRTDFISGMVKSFSDSKSKAKKGIALGLGVADMYREMLELKKQRSEVEREYKRFFPKEILKSMYVHLNKDTVRKPLKEIELNPPGDLDFVMQKYVEQLRESAKEILVESYHCDFCKSGENIHSALLVETSFKELPKIVLRNPVMGEMEICHINELCFVCVRDLTVELSRSNGIPVCFSFQSSKAVNSFVSCISGYYRLCEKPMFNLCNTIFLPSLMSLMRNRFHGPVGGSFAYRKLDEKRRNAPGSYLVRESHKKYGEFYLDYVEEGSSQARTITIHQSSEVFCKEGDAERYSSLQEVVESVGLRQKDCLAPSENDRPSLLLHCRLSEEKEISQTGKSTRPVCIPDSELSVFRGREWEMKGKFTSVRRGFWKDGKEEKSIVIKSSGTEIKDTKPFLHALRTCLHWSDDCIATFHGILLSLTLVPSLVMEYFPLGPLDVFLRKEKDSCSTVDLVEASTYLAKALFYLSERNAVHGKIRAWNVFVSRYSQDSLRVKLADPIVPANLESELAWIPIEFHSRPPTSLNSPSTDVWAMGTTLWEVFSLGARPYDGVPASEITASFLYGKRPSKPRACPIDIYRVMLECWDLDPTKRKTPQAVMRDMNQIFYGVFNARRKHDYQDLDEEGLHAGKDVYLESELCSIASEDQTTCPVVDRDSEQDLDLSQLQLMMNGSMNITLSDFVDDSSNDYSLSSEINDIYVLGKDQVQIGTRIGKGHYGEVRLGTLRRRSGENVLVAVKRVINIDDTTDSTAVDDMMREFEIMKTLRHPKIVEIIGIIESPEFLLVMEYIPFESLLKYLRTESDRIADEHLVRFASDIAEGMEYLAQKNIVHRDLAARNILVVNETSVKISDFGLAQKVGADGYYSFKTLRSLPLPWYAPESIGQWTFSSHSDVWSYGVTLFEMFSRGAEPTLADNDNLLSVLESGKRLSCPVQCPQIVYREVMWPCWRMLPKDRPTFTQILEILCQVSHQI